MIILEEIVVNNKLLKRVFVIEEKKIFIQELLDL